MKTQKTAEKQRRKPLSLASVRQLGGASKPAGKAGPVEKNPTVNVVDPERDQSYRESIRLWFLIYDVSRLHRSSYDALMKRLSISRTEWAVLAELSRHDAVTQTQLAKKVDMPKAGIGVAIERLENSGWLRRASDAEDRRARRVYLVAAAKPIIRQMSRSAGKFSEQILVDLSTEERLTMTRALLKIKNSMLQRRQDGKLNAIS